jgi:guanylate kinase
MRSEEAVQDGLGQRADQQIAALRSGRHPRLFIISGPSGVGKDAIIEQLRVRFPESFFAVTATTRERRPGEIDGFHYIFLTEETFSEKLADGEFLESASVYGVGHYGVLKGPIASALSFGQDAFVKVDVQGAETLRNAIPEAISIFIAPESMQELLRRLQSRKTDEGEALMRRFGTASRELETAPDFDYLVFNEADRLDQAIEQIAAIVIAERCRVHQPQIVL